MTATRPWASALAWGGTALLLAVMIGVGLAAGGLPGTPDYVLPMLIVVVGCYGAVGALLITRIPRHPIGWILWIAGATMGLNLAASDWTALGARIGGLPANVLAAWLANWTFSPALAASLLFLPLLFPDGRLPSPRWRAVAAAFGVMVVLVALPDLLRPGPLGGGSTITNPTGIPGSEDALAALSTITSVCALIGLPLAIAAAVVRYRRGSVTERQQLRWFGAAVGLAASGLLTALILPSALLANLGWTVAMTGLGCIPVAIGIAVLRYRLYEIDRIISRTIAWLVLTALLAGVFAALIVGLEALLAPITETSTLVVAASTLATFAMFQPLRRRVQAVVDRRFNRAQVGAQRAIDAFGAHLRDEVDLAMLEHRLTGTVDGAMRPSQIALWIRDEEAT